MPAQFWASVCRLWHSIETPCFLGALAHSSGISCRHVWTDYCVRVNPGHTITIGIRRPPDTQPLHRNHAWSDQGGWKERRDCSAFWTWTDAFINEVLAIRHNCLIMLQLGASRGITVIGLSVLSSFFGPKLIESFNMTAELRVVY